MPTRSVAMTARTPAAVMAEAGEMEASGTPQPRRRWGTAGRSTPDTGKRPAMPPAPFLMMVILLAFAGFLAFGGVVFVITGLATRRRDPSDWGAGLAIGLGVAALIAAAILVLIALLARSGWIGAPWVLGIAGVSLGVAPYFVDHDPPPGWRPAAAGR